MGNRKYYTVVQIFFYGFIFISLYFGISGNGEAVESSLALTELEQISEVMDKHQIDVTNWTLYSRDLLNSWTEQGEFKDELKAIQQKTEHFNWQPLVTSESNGQTKALATFDHPDLGVTETLTYIVYPHNEELHSYLIYEVHGSKKVTNEHKQTIFPILISRLEDLFKKDTKIFTCISGNSSDKLNFGLYQQAERLLRDFSADKIEELKEETFISISAYTKAWNKSIQSNGKKMNLQVAIRDQGRLGGKTTITIGTPIITTEY